MFKLHTSETFNELVLNSEVLFAAARLKTC